MARCWNIGPSHPRWIAARGCGAGCEPHGKDVAKAAPPQALRRNIETGFVRRVSSRPGLCNLSHIERPLYQAATFRMSRMLIASIVLAVAAVIAVIALFIREGVEKRGYLKNARRKPGRIPLN